MLFFASVPRAEARRPAGPPADAATCAEARMVNGGHLMQRVLRCHAAAAAAGRRVARPCIRRAVIQFAKALKRVDRPGTCVRASEAAFALVQFGGFAEAAAAGLRPARNPSRCVSVKLRVTGAAAAQVLAATGRSGRDLERFLANVIKIVPGVKFEADFLSCFRGLYIWSNSCFPVLMIMGCISFSI